MADTTNYNKPTRLRTRVIPVRVSEDLYKQLTDISIGLDLPIATYCYLAVRKAVSFQHDIMHPDDVAADHFIP